MRIYPRGVLSFPASTSTDVVRYRIYWSKDEDSLLPENLDYDSTFFEMEHVPGWTNYNIELGSMGLPVTPAEEPFYFAVVSLDSFNNLSDPSPVVEALFIGSPPLPPTEVTYESPTELRPPSSDSK